MVKKTGPKSSEKKKSTSKKKTAPQKSARAPGAKKKDLKEQKKPVKKAAAKAKPKAKPKAAAKAKAKKSAAPKKAKVLIKDVLFRKFDTSGTVAKSLYKPKAATLEMPEAPPFVTGQSAKETKRIKALLLKAFDLKAPAPAAVKKKAAPAKKTAAKPKAKGKPKAAPKAKAKKSAAPKKAKVSIKELLFKKFDTGAIEALTAKSPYKPGAASEIPDAPPFVTGYDTEETKRIRALLFKGFDLQAQTPVEEIGGGAAVRKAPEPKLEDAERRVPPTPPASVSSGGPHSVAKAMVLGLCGLGLLIAIIIGASLANRDKFYLRDVDGAVQVWRGKFAPSGAELVISLDGMKIPNPIHDVYSEKEAFGIVYDHFQNKADTALNEAEGPDLGKVNGYLRQASSYAPTVESREMIQRRLDGISFLVLLHKSDVALAKARLPDLRDARTYLAKAASCASMDYQREVVEKRQFVVKRAIAALVAQKMTEF